MSPTPRPSLPRLGVDATALSTDRTGIENYIHQLLPHLTAAWEARGGGVVVYAREPQLVMEALARLDPRASAAVSIREGGGRGWTQRRLAGALRRDAVGVFFNPVPILPLVGRLSCPSVVTVHDFHEFRRGRWWYVRRLLARTLRRATAVVCVSESTRMEVVGEFPWVAGRCVVIHEGADPEVFRAATGARRPADSAVLRHLNIGQAPLLAVGTIQPRKNYARLLRAYSTLPPGAPPLVIAGKPGWDCAEILAMPAALGLDEGRVHFVGHVGESDLADLMRAALALCAVSTAEGFGLPLVEAMFTGLPIVASDIPPFREVAGNAAIFVNPLDERAIAAGLLRVCEDSALRLRLGEAGLGRRGLFSWSSMAEEIAALLAPCLPNAPLIRGT